MNPLQSIALASCLTLTLLVGCNEGQTLEPKEQLQAQQQQQAKSSDSKEAETAVAMAPTATEAVTAAEFTSLQTYQQSIVKRCETAADCVVKNVGSCCGYTPQCVHKDVQTFPEQVKKMCEKEELSSICGFHEPAGCSCIDNQCRENPAASLQ